MVATIRDAVKAAQLRAREWRVDSVYVFLSAWSANQEGSDHRDGGRVAASSYGYLWSTSTVTSERQPDGTIAVTISRSCTRTVRFPARWWDSVTVMPEVLKGGGDCAIRRKHGWDCYDAAGELVGVAVPMPDELKERFGRYDHGRTVAEAEAEIKRKRAVLAAEREAKRLSERAERAARLLARIGANVMIGYDDARAIGACDAGIRAFGARIGVTDMSKKIPLAEISKLEPVYAARLARHVIQRSRFAVSRAGDQ